MQTRIYIDGYNLYYGRLKSTPYKWLDLEALFTKNILPSILIENTSFDSSQIMIKYFTADIVDKAAIDEHSTKDQETYHNALKAHSKNRIEIHKGYYSISKVSAFKVDGAKYPRDCERVEIWRLEEKQSDVNLATEALFDSMTEQIVEHVVIVSNDTDLAAPMIKIKEYNKVRLRNGWNPIRIGLVVPTHASRTKEQEMNQRRPNKILSDLADWTVKAITDEWLINSQLPYKVFSGRRPSVIPISWHPSAEGLSLIMKELQKVNKFGECWKWLETVKPQQEGLMNLTNITPLEAIRTKEGVQGVYEHAKKYRKWKQSQ